MAKEIDYSKAKALAKQFIECIGDDDVGEDPKLPKPETQVNDGGVEPNTQFLKTTEAKESELGIGASKKKSKDSQLAMMGAMLSKKFSGGK